MDPLLIKGRYKIVQRICTDHNFAALGAIDIFDKTQAMYLLNVFEGDYRKQYIDILSTLKHCSSYIGCFNYMDSLVAVFKIISGKGINDVFYKGAKHSFENRMFYTDKLFELAINMADVAPEISCAAFMSDNLIVAENEERILVNFVIKPMLGCTNTEMILLLIDQINKINIPNYNFYNKELEFLNVINLGGYSSMPQLYAYWLNMKQAIISQHKAVSRKNWVSRQLYMFFINVGRMFKRKR